MPDKGGIHPPKGSEQQAKAAKITGEINSMQTQPPVQLPTQNDDNYTNQFPANLIPKDPYDDTYDLKRRNAAADPYTGRPVQFQQEITKEDIDYQKRKAEVVNNLRYKTWLTNAIDMSDPAQVALAREKGVLGDYYDEREKLIDYWHDVSARIAKMRLLGRSAWGPEDYKLAYAIKTGVLRLPSGSLMQPDSYRLGGTNTQNRRRGFFNPHRLFRGWSSRFLRTREDPFPELSGAGQGPDGLWPGADANDNPWPDASSQGGIFGATPGSYSVNIPGMANFHM